jgi:predicted kinase
MKQVTIMRGPSGAGKGAWIVDNTPASAQVISADMFFMKEVEPLKFEYQFDPYKLSEAHAWCMSVFLKLLKNTESIIVDNTNIKHWQFENYVLAAQLAGYDVRVVSITGFTIEDIKLCAKRNVHGTPLDVVAKMFLEFEPYEDEEIVLIGGGV